MKGPAPPRGCATYAKVASVLGLVLLTLLPSRPAEAQLAGAGAAISRDEERPYAFGAGIGYGEFLQRDSWQWGVSVDVSRNLPDRPVGLAASIMWDRETPRGSAKSPVESVTAAVSAAYLISDRFSVGTGLGKGLMDDDNGSRSLRFGDGDWATGAFANVQLERSFVSVITGIFEYNLEDHQTSVSIDLGFGLPF